MNIAEYREMSDRESTYWWHTGRMSIIERQLQGLAGTNKLGILNIGCGTGGTISTLEKFGTVTNIDISPEALKYLKKNGYSGKLVKDHRLPFKDSSFDLVVALDVLEHIDLDRSSLDEWKRVLKKNGNILVTVPAYNFLWSGHDTSLHHYRRYTRSSLNWDLKKAGFSKIKLSYMISFSLPLVVGFRMLHKLTGKKMNEQTSYVSLPQFINNLFHKLLVIESYSLKYINHIFGTSVLAVYKK